MAKRGQFIGSAYVSITGDDSKLGKILANVRKRLRRFGESMKRFGLKMIAVGAAITAPLALAVKQFASLGDEVAKASRRTGLSTEAFSELSHAARLSGSTAEAFEKGLKKLAQTADQAKIGLKTYTREFERLGISVTDNEGKFKTIEALFLEVGTAIGKMGSDVEQAAAASAIFGRAGTQLIPLFELGAEGIAHYREEARRLGISIGPEMAKRAERLTDMFERMKAAFKGIVLVVGNTLAPMFDKVQVILTNLLVNVRRYLKANPELITGLQNIATTLVAVGAGFVVLGTATKALAVLVSPGGVLLALAAILAYVSGLLDPLIKKWGEVVLGFKIGGQTIEQWLSLIAQSFKTLVATIGRTLQHIAPLFGPLLEATKSTFASIWQQAKLGFLEFKQWIFDQIVDIVGTIQTALAKLLSGGTLGSVASQVVQGLEGAAGSIVDALSAGRLGRQGEILGQRNIAALSSEQAAADRRDAAGLFGPAFSGAADSLMGGVSDILGMWGRRISPIIDKIFGQKSVDKVRSLFDIFTGLGKDFKEFTAPGLRAAPAGAAARAGTLLSGTFSGRAEAVRGATRTTDLLGEIAKTSAATARILDRKLTGPAWTAEEKF